MNVGSRGLRKNRGLNMARHKDKAEEKQVTEPTTTTVTGRPFAFLSINIVAPNSNISTTSKTFCEQHCIRTLSSCPVCKSSWT